MDAHAFGFAIDDNTFSLINLGIQYGVFTDAELEALRATGLFTEAIDAQTEAFKNNTAAIVEASEAGRKAGLSPSFEKGGILLSREEFPYLTPEQRLEFGTLLRFFNVDPATVKAGDVEMGAGDDVGLKSFQHGTDYVPHDMMARLHEGEAVIPAEENRERSKQQSGPVYITLEVDRTPLARIMLPAINDLVERNRYRLVASETIGPRR